MQSRKGKGSWFVDSVFTLFNASDFTKQVRLSLAALTTGVLRTFSFPNTTTDVTLAHTGVDAQTFGGQFNLAAGTMAAPTIAWPGGDGMYYSGISMGYVRAGNERIQFNTGLTVGQTANSSGDNSGTITINGQASATTMLLARYSTDAVGPVNSLRHARGTLATPTAVVLSDGVGSFDWRAYTGAAFTTCADLTALIVETGTVSASTAGTRLRFRNVPIGSGTLSDTLGVSADVGLTFGNIANVFLDQNRNHRLRSYTLATLPTSVESMLIGCSDTGGGTSELRGDGTGWERMGNGGYQTLSNTTSFTWTSLTNAANVRLTGAIAADQTVTLATTNARAGHWCIFTRTGTGAFNWSIGGLKNLALNTWCRVKFDGTAWFLAAYGTL